MAIYVGLLVNPVTRTPVHVVWDERHIKIYGLWEGRFQYLGQGYYGGADADDCPRTHTPAGVRVQKRGFGTMLYCGLALGSIHPFSENLTYDNACVHSISGDRSSSAEAWWRAAVSKGLAEPTDGSDEYFDEDWSDYFDVDSFEHLDDRVTQIDGWQVQVQGIRGSEGQMLTVKSIAEHGLIGVLAGDGNSEGQEEIEFDLDAWSMEEIPIEPKHFARYDWLIPEDGQEAAPLLAMGGDDLPQALKIQLREIMAKAGVSPAEIARAGYAIPTDSERVGGRQRELELERNPPNSTVRQVRQIWRSLGALP